VIPTPRPTIEQDDHIAAAQPAYGPPALEIAGAIKRFRKDEGQKQPLWKRRERKPRQSTVAVDSMDVTVSRGEIFGLLGANGSGKSTLIRLVSTLLIPDGGEIRVFGHDVRREERIVRRMINRVSVEASFLEKRE